MKGIVDKIGEFLEEQMSVRDKLLSISNKTIRKSSRAMGALHRGEDSTVEDIIEEMEEDIAEINDITGSEPQFLEHGAVIAAHREFSEVVLTRAFIKGETLPDPDDLDVIYKGYAQAMPEAVGELRRHFLDLLRKDEVQRAVDIHEEMESIFDSLVQFDFPDSILTGMKHRKDMVRETMEKTRSDITRAVREKRLENALVEKEERVRK